MYERGAILVKIGILKGKGLNLRAESKPANTAASPHSERVKRPERGEAAVFAG